MTREEAITILNMVEAHGSLVIQAKDMAIKALEYDDAKYHEEHGEVIVDKAVWEDAKRVLEQEPRQDLQQAAERIIEQQNKWFEEQERKEQEPAYCDRNICIKNEYNNIGCEECEVTKSQEPPTGHWIYKPKTDLSVCDKCGSYCPQDKYGRIETNFCPNCGCRMVEPACDTCEYEPAAFTPCNACKDKSEYKPKESEE